MKNVLKNWWFAVLGVVMVILDSGFDVVNPVLEMIGLPDKWVNLVKACFALYGIIRLKQSLPTQNVDKLQKIVDEKIADDGGAVLPGKGL